MNRRAFMAGVGASVASVLLSRGRGSEEEEEETVTLEDWDVTRGVVTLHVTGVHEDEMVRVTWYACGIEETWCTTHAVTEYESDGWHAVTDVEGADVDPDAWTQAVPLDVEVTG